MAEAANSTGARILVVDDEKDICEILEFNLENAGGDDYISKPFSIQEVLARVKAVLRRSSPPSGEQHTDVLETGSLQIDPKSKMVYVSDTPVTLSKKEFELISLLAAHPGKVFSREEIIDRLWKDAPYVLDRTIDVHIARIRAKLGPMKSCITNRSGFGYSFHPLL